MITEKSESASGPLHPEFSLSVICTADLFGTPDHDLPSLASKLGWPQSRLTTAAQELHEFGRAEVKSGGWIRPVGEATL